MQDTILTTIKLMLGLDPNYNPFDTEVVVHINSALNVLYQLGLSNHPLVINQSTTWGDLFGSRTDLEAVKTWIYLKVKILFDPPTSATVLEAFQREVKELEWRINVELDPPENNPLIPEVNS